MRAPDQSLLHLEERMAALEHLLHHTIVTVLARTDDPADAADGFGKRLAAPLRRSLAAKPGTAEDNRSELRVLALVEQMAQSVRDDIAHALAQARPRRK